MNVFTTYISLLHKYLPYVAVCQKKGGYMLRFPRFCFFFLNNLFVIILFFVAICFLALPMLFFVMKCFIFDLSI